ncbi:MAG: hypothetical protein WBF75_10960 [Pseudonocardiaceae bacterium]
MAGIGYPWTDQDLDATRNQIQPSGDCPICASSWPCPVVTAIHGLLNDPERQFVPLADRARHTE